jgi:hypothetical protein
MPGTGYNAAFGRPNRDNNSGTRVELQGECRVLLRGLEAQLPFFGIFPKKGKGEILSL